MKTSRSSQISTEPEPSRVPHCFQTLSFDDSLMRRSTGQFPHGAKYAPGTGVRSRSRRGCQPPPRWTAEPRLFIEAAIESDQTGPLLHLPLAKSTQILVHGKEFGMQALFPTQLTCYKAPRVAIIMTESWHQVVLYASMAIVPDSNPLN
jgi:hypothetical protein